MSENSLRTFDSLEEALKLFSEEETIQLTYETETMEDEVFQDIKTICYRYLDDKRSIDSINDDELYIAFEFLNAKFQEVNKIKESFKIKSYTWPITEIAKSMDEITIAGSMKASSDNPIFYNLTKDINYTLEHIGFCYGIIDMIIRERNI